MKKFLYLFLIIATCSSGAAASAQQPAKVYRIGSLRAEKAPEVDIEGFRQGLREHGYVEGKNIVVEYRWADGNEERLRSLVSELIGLKVDLIVTSAPAATQAAKEATTTIPIVMVLVADPVAFGFVNSLARPGGNITGFAFLLPEISGKRLELLKETIPKLSRVAVLWNAAQSIQRNRLERSATGSLRLESGGAYFPSARAERVRRCIQSRHQGSRGGAPHPR